MNKRGKEIRIYLDDGSPSGLKRVETDNWDGRIIICPRASFKELLKDWSDEIQCPGVYLLVGGAMHSEPSAYIGKADDVLKRIRLQVKEKDFWTQAFIFTSKGGGLTKTDIGCLEGRIIEKAREVGRVRLENKQTPSITSSKPVQAKVDGYLDYAQEIFITLGIPYLRHTIDECHASQSAQSEGNSIRNDILRFSGKEFNGKGAFIDEGFAVRFAVLKGSTGKLEPAASLSKQVRNLRESLEKEKKTVKKDGRIYFKEDVVFRSLSAAASVLAGGMRNGLDSWKHDDGRTIKKYEEEEWISSSEKILSKAKKEPKTKVSKTADLSK